MKNTKKRGFTIVELVIVIAVIAILASVLIPTFTNVVNAANKSKALQEARNAYTQALADHLAETTDTCNHPAISGWNVTFNEGANTATITGTVASVAYTFTVDANGKITQTTPAENAG